MPKREDKIGALWQNVSTVGDYFTGEVNGQKIVVFRNNYKTTDKHPDWIVYKSQPKGTRDAT